MAQVLRCLPTREMLNDPNLLVGPETFDDAGVYRIAPDLALVQTVDFFPPVVDDPFVYGQIAAANSLSDVYAMGGEPKTALNLVCFPDDKLPLHLLGRILAGGQERIQAAGAVSVGGHTVRDAEIKYGLSVTGVVHPDEVAASTKARPGDVLFLTKALGTGFVTTAHKARRCDDQTLASACASMTTLNAGAAKAMKQLKVQGATDITGFGLAGHANEMAVGSGVTMVLHLEKLPLLPGADRLAAKRFHTRASTSNASFVADVLKESGRIDRLVREFLFDPQTSGGLLMAVPSENAARAEQTLRDAGVSVVARIGEVVERQPGVHLILQP